jgi:hypothetical protein
VSRKSSSCGGATRTLRACATRACGARTRACRVHTRVNAWSPSGVRTRPQIILHPRHQPCLHWIPLNIRRDPAPLVLAAYPMIVGLALPKLLSSSTEQPVSFPRRDTLQGFQQEAGRNRRQQKHVDVVRHDDERSETVLAQALTAEQRFDHQCGDAFDTQVDGPRVCSIQVAIYPNESFAIGDFPRGRKMRAWQAAVQVPREEQPAAGWIDVGQAALGGHALNGGAAVTKISRSHECERCTHECVRHGHSSTRQSSGNTNSYSSRTSTATASRCWS